MVSLKQQEQALDVSIATIRGSDGDLAGALHEVSNALTVVLGWLDHASGQLPADGPASEALEIARAHARLGHTIARRSVGATVEEEADSHSAVALARQTVRGILPRAEERGVAVVLDDKAEDVVLGNTTAIRQILLNLLLNALAFTPRGQGVQLTLRNEGEAFLFRVKDTGPGVPNEQRDNIFANTPSRRPGGAGIGLAYSHRLTERNGGSLALMEEEQGACFELRWPTNSRAQRAPRARAIAPRMLDGLRVLVLEDDRDVMGMLDLGLCSRGVELISVSSREELFEFAGNGSTIDAALIDLSPISDDPRGAIVRLRANSPHAAVFLISGTVLSTELGDDISGWIRKPFELGEIYQALAQAQPE